MKIFYSVFVSFLSCFAFGQTQDLFALASGNFTGFNALFDEDQNLYGYVSIYSYGKKDDKTKKFEYVILDKNLNAVANKEFDGDITASDYYGYIDFRKKLILAPSAYDNSVKSKDFFYPRSIEIDPAKNTAKNKIYYDYEEGIFNVVAQPKNAREERKEEKAEKKEKGYIYQSEVYEIKEGGFLVLEFHEYANYVNHNSLIKFDDNKKEVWRFAYNTSGDKKINEKLRLIDKNEKYIFCILQNSDKKEKKFHLLVLDMKTGKEVARNPITGLSPETLELIPYYFSYYQNLDNDKIFQDKIVMVGRNFDKMKSNGFARLLIDKNTFAVDTKTLDYKADFQPFLPKLTRNDYFTDGYELRTKDFFFLQDGSVGILMEKYKPEGQYNAPKTKDLYYAFTDKDFKIKEIKIFEKEKSKWVNDDYLFSQYLNDGKDVVFFYRDLQKNEETRNKNWKLFINTLIDGKFKQEEVQISEKDHFSIYPYVGKEGYILLREFNEKEKFNKIRLERLNY